MQSKYWKIIFEVVKYVSGGITTWHPYDVAVNVIRSADHTRIHGDVRNNEDDEWTALIYLSPDWETGCYGETAWFTDDSNLSHEAEIETEVQPVYGRLAIFEGLIGHAARPPSSNYLGPRYSFAVKMAKTKWRAMRNMLDEEFHEKVDILTGFNDFLKVKYPKDTGDPEALAYLKSYYEQMDQQSEEGRHHIIEYIKKKTDGDGDRLQRVLGTMIKSFTKRKAALQDQVKNLL